METRWFHFLHSTHSRPEEWAELAIVAFCFAARQDGFFFEPFLHDIASMQGHFSHSHVVVDASFQHLQKRMLGRHSLIDMVATSVACGRKLHVKVPCLDDPG